MKEELKKALRDFRLVKRQIAELKAMQEVLAKQVSPDVKIQAMVAEELKKLGG